MKIRQNINTTGKVGMQNQNYLNPMLTSISTYPLGTSLVKQLGIGIACASYWRGAWYILDDHLFPNNTLYSATASLGLGTAGLALSQIFVANRAGIDLARKRTKLPIQYASLLARFGTLYCVSTSCILVWRGTWLLWDTWYEKLHEHQDIKIKATDPKHLTTSGTLSYVCAMTGLLTFGYFSSVLAPPARATILKDMRRWEAKSWTAYSNAVKQPCKKH